MNSKITISDFSPHLFWDVDMSKFSLEKYPEFMIERVLEYGNLNDWNLLKQFYGKETIKKVSLNLRSLNPVTLSFLSTIFEIDEKEFRCYTNTLSDLNYWNS